MNSKKANRLFLAITVFHFVVVYAMMYLPEAGMNIAVNLVCSELILLLPALLFLVTSGGRWNDTLGFHRMRPATWGMVILFTFLTMPLTTLVNAISMLFVDNVVMEISGDVVDMPFFLMFFLMAVYGPFCEEITFRGLMFNGYKKRGSLLGAVFLSALTFGLMHMNFNQIPYAFVIGILLALLVEATGSIWSSLLYHFIFNAESVCLLYLSNNLLTQEMAESGAVLDNRDAMLYMIGSYAILAAFATTLAVAVLAWIARYEGREDRLRGIWQKRREKKERMVTLPLLAAVAACIAYSLLLALV